MDNLFLYKIMILYMLDRIDSYTLTNTDVLDFIVSKGYTNAFNVHESLSELLDKGFISVNMIRNTAHYQITSEGEEALFYFENRIPNTIKQEILEYFKSIKKQLKNESEIYADYKINESGEYTVMCIIKERKDTILDLEMVVPTKEMAVQMCDNWRSKSAKIYSGITASLTSQDMSQDV